MKMKKLRIVAKAASPAMRARGQDTAVMLVHEDGTEEVLPNIVGVQIHISVDGRSEYVTATIQAHVEVDVEAVVDAGQLKGVIA